MANPSEILKKAHSNTTNVSDGTVIEVDNNSTEIAAANPDRKSILLQNNGDEPCFIRLGGAAAAAAYNFILAEGTGANLGDGGSLKISEYSGAIYGICAAGDTDISVLELTDD